MLLVSLESLEAANVDSDISGNRDETDNASGRIGQELSISESDDEDGMFQPARAPSAGGSMYSVETTRASDDQLTVRNVQQDYPMVSRGFASTPVLRGMSEEAAGIVLVSCGVFRLAYQR